MKSIFIFIYLFLAGCSVMDADSFNGASQPKIDEIFVFTAVKRSGSDLLWEFKVEKDGKYIYRYSEWSKKINSDGSEYIGPDYHEQVGHLDESKLTNFLNYLSSVGFFKLDNEYIANIHDGIQIGYTLKTNEKFWSVYCDNKFPQSVTKIEKYILDKLLGQGPEEDRSGRGKGSPIRGLGQAQKTPPRRFAGKRFTCNFS